MNLRLFFFAAATLAGSSALASACGAPDLILPPAPQRDGSVAGPAPCSPAESMIIVENTGAQSDAGLDGSVLPSCDGKVVAYDPPSFGESSSEGLCDARLGYLVCHGGCFSEFSCDIPDGYKLVELDGGRFIDGGAGEDADAETDAPPRDVEVDAKPHDGAADARAPDASVDAEPTDAGLDAKPDGLSDASLDVAPADAPTG